MNRLHASLLLATMVVACNTGSADGDRSVSSEPSPSVASPAAEPNAPKASTATEAPAEESSLGRAIGAAQVAPEARYVVDGETGAVQMDIPPEVLADVQAQMIRAGHQEAAEQLGRLYDPKSGHVADEAKARSAEAALRAAAAGGAR